MSSEIHPAVWQYAENSKIHFHPIVDLDTDEIVGAEALFRPNGCSPQVALAAALKDGSMPQLGQWILSEACSNLAWLLASGAVNGAFVLSVNVHRCQLGPKFFEQVMSQLETNGIPPRRLRLEIIEDGVISRRNELVLRRLEKSGVGSVLDDTDSRTEWAFPGDLFPIWKVSQHLLRGDPGRLEGLVAKARAAGKLVIVEGVETQRDLVLVRRLGVRFVQGFLFSRPIGLQQFITWLAGQTQH